MSKIDIEYNSSYEREVKCLPANDDNIVENKPEDEVRKSDTLFLYFTVITGVLPMLVTEALEVWTSPVLVKFSSNDTGVNPFGRPITESELSVTSALTDIVLLIGTILVPLLADLIGRKRSLQILCFASFLSTVLLAFSNTFSLLLVSSTLLGILFAGVSNILPIYLTEICEDHNRAKFGCLLSLFIPVGELFAFIVGPDFSPKDFALITAAPMIPFLLIFLYVPESPVYSLKRGREEECLKALRKLRSNKTSTELHNDFNEMRQTLTEQTSKFNITKLFSSKEGRIGVFLGSLPMFVQLFCGVPIVMSLLGPIFDESGSNLPGNTIAITVGVAKVLSFIVAFSIIEATGRKHLLVMSSIGTGLAISILGIFFYLKDINSPIVLQFQWMPLVLTLVYIIAFSLGIGTIPVVLVGELFTSELRTSAFAFISTLTGFSFMLYAAIISLAAETVETHWSMWIFGGVCFLGAFFMHIMLTETKGKSIGEIQEILRKY